jgi:DNA repair ATPase RecN
LHLNSTGTLQEKCRGVTSSVTDLIGFISESFDQAKSSESSVKTKLEAVQEKIRVAKEWTHCLEEITQALSAASHLSSTTLQNSLKSLKEDWKTKIENHIAALERLNREYATAKKELELWRQRHEEMGRWKTQADSLMEILAASK